MVLGYISDEKCGRQWRHKSRTRPPSRDLGAIDTTVHGSGLLVKDEGEMLTPPTARLKFNKPLKPSPRDPLPVPSFIPASLTSNQQPGLSSSASPAFIYRSLLSSCIPDLTLDHLESEVPSKTTSLSIHARSCGVHIIMRLTVVLQTKTTHIDKRE